ncbi:MAG: M23 family metallopeptidase [Eubacteriales bacterium]|nr:M23 family metallopeptidase [Eubacteriales bacterium]
MTNNNSGNKNQFSGKNNNLSAFFNKYGVLVALGGCAVIIGGTWLFTNDDFWGKQPDAQNTPPAIVQNDDTQSGTDLSERLDDVQKTASPATTPAPTAQGVAQTNDPTAPGAIPKMVKPVAGTVKKNFAVDKLLYSETLNQWQTHGGVDFAVSDGDDVLCVLDGTINAVYNDLLWGSCVEVKHADGLTSLYAGLKDTGALKTGTEVKQGQVLAKAGGTIPCEAEDGLHLHFEMKKNGVAINSEEYFIQ